MLSALSESRCPVVSGAAARLGHEDVLGVVQLAVLAVADVVDHARLQVQEHGTRDVVVVVGLDAKNYIFSLHTFYKVFKNWMLAINVKNEQKNGKD